MSWVDEIFGRTGDLTTAQECARAVLILAYGLVAIRLAGRRMFAKWSALDIVVSIIVGSNLSRTLTGTAPLLGTLAATTLLMALHWLLARLAALSPGLSRLIEGRPVSLVDEGRRTFDARVRWGVSDADLDEAIRQQDAGSVEETQAIVLEPSGKISVLKRRRDPHR